MTDLKAIFRDPEKGLSRGAFLASAKKAGYSAKDATEHYNHESTAQIHRFTKPKYHSIVARPNSWAVDLTFYNDYSSLPANKQKIGILVCLEQTSRFAFCRPFRTKSPEELAPLLKQLIKEHKVSFVVTDDGNEWKSDVAKLFAQNDIQHYATSRKGATSRVERFNRTLREKIERWFSASGTHAWVSILPKLVASHNNAPSRVLLGHTPVEVLNNPTLDYEVRKNDLSRGEQALEERESFEDGVQVRTSLEKTRFDKKSGQKWSPDIKIVENDPENRYLLRVRNQEGKLDRRRYAAWELQQVPEDTISGSVGVAPTDPSKAVLGDTVDIPKVRKAKKAKQLLNRESISHSAIVSGPRSSRGRTPSRLLD